MKSFNLINHTSLIENYPCHIATVTKNNLPNLAVAADIKVLDKDTLLISHNEMVNTPKNIESNKNVVLTTFNENWEGLKIKGTATYHTSGEYMQLCNQFFKNEDITPKGCIVVKVSSIDNFS